MVRIKSQTNRLYRQVYKAVRDGIIPKAGACQQCAKHVSLDAHHSDYTNPLLVTWLCRRCHKRTHHPGWLLGVKLSEITKKSRLRHTSIGLVRNRLGGWVQKPEVFVSTCEMDMCRELSRETLRRTMCGTRKLHGTTKSYRF